MESASSYLANSASLYKAAGMTKDANETITRQNEIEKQLKELKESQNHILNRKKISATKPKESPTLTNSSIAAPKNQTEPSNNHILANVSTLSPKKRKNLVILNEEEPASKKSTVSTDE